MIELISVIIPTLNEAPTVVRAVESAGTGREVETIVADGGSADKTVALAEAAGARVIRSDPGRSRQMNQAAGSARGEILVFLHADTLLPPGFDRQARQIIAQRGIVAGAFRLAINGSSPSLRLIEKVANWRSTWLQMPYGDQALFLKAPIFHSLNGFRDMALMEDFDLVRRLRRMGRIVIAPHCVLTSDRRWRTRGPWKTTLLNQISIVAYSAGVSPTRIERWYYGNNRARTEVQPEILRR